MLRQRDNAETMLGVQRVYWGNRPVIRDGRKHELRAGTLTVGLQGRPDKVPGNPMRKSGSKITHERNPI